MLLQKKHVLPNMLPLLAYCGFGLLLLLAIVLRVSLYPIETSDYTIFVSRWSDFIYAPYLIQTQIVPLPYVAVAVLAIAIITFVDLVLALYPNRGKREDEAKSVGGEEVA